MMQNKDRGRFLIFRSESVVFWLLLLTAVSAFLSLRFGSAAMSSADFFAALVGRGKELHEVILYHVRLPRMLGGLFGGIGLSVSGALLQSVTDNPLAAPSVVGVNAGAGAAVVLCLAFLPGFSLLSPIIAFFGAFGVSILLLFLTRLLGGSRVTLVLLGTAMNALLGAVISFFTLLDGDLLSVYHSFSIGGLSGVTGDALLLPAVIILSVLVLASLLMPHLAVLSLGDARAASLGMRPARLRLSATLLASASAAAVVSFAGLLGFVGLIVPHLARRLSGYAPRRTLLASALLGASLLLLSDLFSRILLAPTEIPVGILTALLGAPFLVVLLLMTRGGERA